MTDSYVLSYSDRLRDPEDSDQRRPPIRVPRGNGVKPVISTQIAEQNGLYSYSYQIQNAPSARLAINWIAFVVDPENRMEGVVVPLWSGTGSAFPAIAAKQQGGMTTAPEGGFVSWFGLPTAAIAPGKTAPYFRLTSEVKPGFTTAYFRGGPPGLSFDTEGPPSEVLDQLEPLITLEKDSYLTLILAPVFTKNYPLKDLAANFYQGTSMLVKFKLSDTKLPDGSRVLTADGSPYQYRLTNESGKLDGDSPFVKEALAKLKEYMGMEASAIASQTWTDVKAKPANDLEKQIATALALAMKDE